MDKTTFDELSKQAIAEGVDVDGGDGREDSDATQDAKEGASSTPKETGASPDSASGAAKSTEENVPWHKTKHAIRLSESNRQLKEQLAEYKQLMEAFKSGGFQKSNPAPQNANLSEDDRAALLKLTKLMRETPEVAESLGLTTVEKLNQQLNQMQTARLEESFNSELDRSLDKYAEKYGKDRDELAERLQEFMEENPFYGSKEYQRGMVESAMKAMLFEEVSTLSEASVNKKLIQEKKNRQSNNTESPSKGAASKGIAKEKNMKDYLLRRVKEEGGEVQFD